LGASRKTTENQIGDYIIGFNYGCTNNLLEREVRIDTPHSATLANGSLYHVVGFGHTHLSPDIEFLSVLHVPSFPFNLLSISKITKALNCSVSFYPSLCIFQDLKTRRMIGMGH
jgi:hypothetical protein